MTAMAEKDYKETAQVCSDCISFVFVWRDLLDYNENHIDLGICKNEGCNHYAHQLEGKHPACDTVMTKGDLVELQGELLLLRERCKNLLLALPPDETTVRMEDIEGWIKEECQEWLDSWLLDDDNYRLIYERAALCT